MLICPLCLWILHSSNRGHTLSQQSFSTESGDSVGQQKNPIKKNTWEGLNLPQYLLMPFEMKTTKIYSRPYSLDSER